MTRRRRDILAITPFLPKPDQQSGDRRFLALLKMMARDDRVTLCLDRPADRESPPVGSNEQRRYLAPLHDAGVRVLPFGVATALAALLTGRPRYEIGLFEFPSMARRYGGLFRRFNPTGKGVVDTVDVHFMRLRAAAELRLPFAGDLAEETEAEMALYRRADATIAVSEEDRAAVRQEGGVGRVVVLPNVLEERPRDWHARPPIVLFVGGFTHTPNLDSIRWFVREAWPAVRAAVPDALLQVVGSNATSEVYALGDAPGVHVLGRVPDTAPYLDRATVSIAPLRYGAGMKGKVNEAMASAVPVVATRFGVQGLGAVHGEHLLQADEAGPFADAVITLLTDPARARRIGLAGQTLTAALCGPDVVSANLRRLLDDLVPADKPPAYRSLKARAMGRAFGAALAMRDAQWLRDFTRRSGVHTR